jgi:hypothetical protein
MMVLTSKAHASVIEPIGCLARRLIVFINGAAHMDGIDGAVTESRARFVSQSARGQVGVGAVLHSRSGENVRNIPYDFGP